MGRDQGGEDDEQVVQEGPCRRPQEVLLGVEGSHEQSAQEHEDLRRKHDPHQVGRQVEQLRVGSAPAGGDQEGQRLNEDHAQGYHQGGNQQQNPEGGAEGSPGALHLAQSQVLGEDGDEAGTHGAPSHEKVDKVGDAEGLEVGV